MKKQTVPQETFKIKFTKLILLPTILVFILCGLGIGLSIWRMQKFGVHEFLDVLKYPFLIAVCVFCIVVMISLLIKSQYAVTEEHLITQYGFIKSKFALKEITELTLDLQVQKLKVNFGEQFLVLKVSEEWNERFVRAMLKGNPDISYSFTLADKPEEN